MGNRPLAGRLGTWPALMIAALATLPELGCQRLELITPILKTTVQVAIMVPRLEVNLLLTFKLRQRANPVIPQPIRLLALLNSTILVLLLVVLVAIMVKLPKVNLLVIFQQALAVNLVTRQLAFWERNLITVASRQVVQVATMALQQKVNLLVISQQMQFVRLAINQLVLS